jgi:hypothetical protein
MPVMDVPSTVWGTTSGSGAGRASAAVATFSIKAARSTKSLLGNAIATCSAPAATDGQQRTHGRVIEVKLLEPILFRCSNRMLQSFWAHYWAQAAIVCLPLNCSIWLGDSKPETN